MANSFADVIEEVLNQMGPGILQDRTRFLAAIQDLAGDFEAEKKLLNRCLDERVLSVCRQAEKKAPEEWIQLRQRNQQYLQREYMVSAGWAAQISQDLILGIGRYFRGDEASAMPEHTFILDSPDDNAFGDDRAYSDHAGLNASADRSWGNWSDPDPGYENRVPYEPIRPGRPPQPSSYGPYRGRKSRLPMILAAVLIGLGLGIGTFLGLSYGGIIPFGPGYNASDEETGSDSTSDNDSGEDSGDSDDSDGEAVGLTPDDLEILTYDINYSQITHQEEGKTRPMSFEKDGIDVLMEVKNLGDDTLRSFDFHFNQYSEDVENVKDGGTTFTAWGLIEAGKTGYMYSKIHVPNNTPGQSQGKLRIAKVKATGNPDGFRPATGTIGSLNSSSDTYPVTIDNRTDLTLHRETSTVIAVERDTSSLGGAWGAGSLNGDIASGETQSVGQAIYNPGFNSFDPSKFDVFVIDTEYLK